jgi:hypothetical protein
VADDLLSRLDESLIKPSGPVPRIARPVDQPQADLPEEPSEGMSARERRDQKWMIAFLAVQFLWGALLFIPGAQAYRSFVRALPYAASAGLLGMYVPRVMHGRAPRGTIPLVLALGLIVVNLLHPTSLLQAGIAQCVFQATIAAPMFWGWKAVRRVEVLKRLLWCAFVFNAAGAVLGVLQVYYPAYFMPPQFSSLGLQMNDAYVESLTYEGPDGTLIVRPPGLTDQPGGAALSGALAVVLGTGLGLCTGSARVRVLTLGIVAIGLAVMYLTQVRSVLLMSVATLAVIAALLFRRNQAQLAARVAVSAAILVVGSFLWARAIGGQAVERRFMDIAREGAVKTYQQNRGGFVNETFGQLLDEYPLGAGVGRWGMMGVYFNDPTSVAPPIYVEIQITGWLLDGGIPMWVLYGSAILLALLTAYELAIKRALPVLSDTALICLGVEFLIVGFAWAGPVFNTQLGILFWFLVSTLYGASREHLSGWRPAASRTAQ